MNWDKDDKESVGKSYHGGWNGVGREMRRNRMMLPGAAEQRIEQQLDS